ncbi:proline-rich receptor-like protein kinase PERK9 [Iris pallida]|uniref:Proline-rich receptor-like protein kinase PERK9 n=1 Tax=Iris pallida TaxID=29817 RepID=A0AAX6F1G6_IRIPA|nr:proline-rich receptor-like protein kinase PERK9 [Iris pallida]
MIVRARRRWPTVDSPGGRADNRRSTEELEGHGGTADLEAADTGAPVRIRATWALRPAEMAPVGIRGGGLTGTGEADRRTDPVAGGAHLEMGALLVVVEMRHGGEELWRADSG